ncbi:pirin family protein [Microbacterium sp. Marseille-Q6965]|uniref:pirin family protein n=1 Tax=Microbacterium sp. Marseille-Q6965 TaxID=2965072 RepID=UPI0021B7D1E4|nr:pirin family protein [Microbacterium sp. Marseille-Q6965]
MTRYDVDARDAVDGGSTSCDGPRALLLEPRRVPLGGVRAMDVSRSLPQRDLPLVGAWCFLDRFGPQEAMMRVDPHPHIGLQTVTWPLVGEVRHRDAVGSDVLITRGQLNIMTAGDGISHSEYSVGDEPGPIDALQLWIALPDHARRQRPHFEQHRELPSATVAAVEGADPEITVVVGSFAGVDSPAAVYSPIVGAEVRLAPGSRVRLPFDPAWEYAVVQVEGDLRVHDAAPGGTAPMSLDRLDLLYLGVDRDGIEVSTEDGAMIFLLGGEPFGEDIVMWWNFVGRTHDEVAEAREQWEARDARFGAVVGHPADDRIPAPPLPNVRLTARRRRI